MAAVELQRFESANGARIYQIPVRAFPSLIAHAYLVIDEEYCALIDTGSGGAASNADLMAGLQAVRDGWDERLRWSDLSRIILTHGHIDHYGGLDLLRRYSAAPVALHALDLPAVQEHAAHLARRAVALTAFLRWAGADEQVSEHVVARYRATLGQVAGGPVATVLQEGMLLDQRFTVVHTPGHCAGQVCLRLDDVLFCGDHMLATTSPRLVPALLEPHNGLAAYLDALERTAALPGIRLVLAGHEAPFTDLYRRCADIRAGHLSRLDQLLGICSEPRTVVELAAEIYPQLRHPDRLLVATQAVAARIEYLQQQGALVAIGLQQPTLQAGATRYLRAA